MGLQIAPCKGTIFSGKDMPGKPDNTSAVSCAKMAELVEMSFGLWTRVGLGKHVLCRMHTGTTW